MPKKMVKIFALTKYAIALPGFLCYLTVEQKRKALNVLVKK